MLLRGTFPAAAASACLFRYSTAQNEAALSPAEFRALRVKQVTKVSGNTNRYRFEFPDQDMSAGPDGMPVASILVTRAPIGSLNEESGTRKNVIRPYTPISAPEQKGYLDLLVKVYPEGKMSAHFGTLKPGDTLDMKGPFLKFKYQASEFDHIGCVAGGTGITPMLQVIDKILSNPEDTTKVSLVFANVTENDILMRSHIDALACAHPERFTVYYVLDQPPSPAFLWRGGIGYITGAMLKAKLPGPCDQNKILVCGPPGMMNVVSGSKISVRDQGELVGLLQDLGYSKEQVFKF
uniref:cytochrome-b5 reductase n=1 Tax=Octactis speculum TaxID=3111310 RepID=A0A7S2FJB2_9STRA|mmetsp:Transcript_23567/g.32173  ORF Transcript_23567/g.32173 Transcript_23567/m.32173 type:complete len:294 (+) Transcript_23567:3-884(+)